MSYLNVDNETGKRVYIWVSDKPDRYDADDFTIEAGDAISIDFSEDEQ